MDRTHEKGGTGIIRLMFPYSPQSEHGALVAIAWEEFFRQFDEAGLALLHEPDSQFSKIVRRDTAERRATGEQDAHR